MKWTGIIIMFVAIIAAVVPGAAVASSTPELKRDVWAERSGEELRQVRGQVDTTARRLPPSEQLGLAPVYDALSAADQALVEWRAAPNSEIPQFRARLEDATSKVLRLWGGLQVDRRQLSAKKR